MSAERPPRALDALLAEMVARQASDLHLAVGSPPTYRIHGTLMPAGQEPMSPSGVKEMVYSILEPAQQQQFERQKELDFSYSLPGISRYRGNALFQRGTMGAVFRSIPERAPTLEELGLPTVLAQLCERPRGLVLVTGPTGSGKSTTLAAMIERINAREAVHIVTVEDPIEFLYKNKRAIVRQRELGGDTLSFPEALKHVLRQDPNVILVGEMRDLETIALAVTAAETGHLVLATLHTIGAASTVDRIVDVFPPHQQQQIRIQVAGVLEGVISQTLLARTDGQGRVCAMEILIATAAVRNLIREAKSHQLASVMQSGGALGMVTLDTALKRLVEDGAISFEQALLKCGNPDEFTRLCGRDRPSG